MNMYGNLDEKTKFAELSQSEREAILKDFITTYEACDRGEKWTSYHETAFKKVAAKYKITEEMVKKSLLYWIKDNEYNSFLRVLKQKVDDYRDIWWLIKHYEELTHKDDILKRTETYTLGRGEEEVTSISYDYCDAFVRNILKQKQIELSNYTVKSVSNLTYKIVDNPFESIIIIGGVKESGIFEPKFVHDVTKIDSVSLYSLPEKYSNYAVKKGFNNNNYETILNAIASKKANEQNETFEYKACIDTYELAWKLTSKNCNAFIMVHNHINGDVTPSQPDILTTLKLMKAFATLGIDMIDHIICGRVNEDKVALYSMRMYNDIFKRQKHLDYAFQELDQFSSSEEISEFINKNRYAKWKARKQMDEEGKTIPPEHIIEVEIPKEKED